MMHTPQPLAQRENLMARIVRTALVWVWAAATLAALGGCQTLPLTGRTESPHFGPVGPAIGSGSPASHDKVRLDVVVPVFDPGLPEDEDDYEKKGIWPELRRAEANRFAVLLKEELDATGMFGDVHVSPDASATGDLYVMGAIREVRGEDVEIEIVAARDISGSDWLRGEKYEYQVKESFFRYGARNKGKDPYQPVFKQVAEAIVNEVKKRSNEELTSLRDLTEVRFASALAPESFGDHVEREGDRTRLKSLPAENDPMFRNTLGVRVQNGIFMAKMGEQYQKFYDDTQESYLVYQKSAFEAVKEYKKERKKAWITGAAGVAAATVAILVGKDAEANSALEQAVAAGAAIAGVALLRNAFSNVQEARRHEGTLSQLGNDIDLSMSPTVIELEGETVTMTGDAREQLREWRAHLKKMYDLQKVPERKL